MNVGEIMSRDVVACAPGDTLDRAAQIMWERDCGYVPVVDGDRGLVGVVTDRDACMAAYTNGAALRAIEVGDVMSRSVVSCAPDDEIGFAQNRLGEAKVRRMPVVEAGRLVGVISLNDLALSARRRAAGGPSPAQIGETLAAISEHRPSPPVAAAAE